MVGNSNCTIQCCQLWLFFVTKLKNAIQKVAKSKANIYVKQVTQTNETKIGRVGNPDRKIVTVGNTEKNVKEGNK